MVPAPSPRVPRAPGYSGCSLPPANTMRSRHIFCDAVAKNIDEFAHAFTTNISAALAISEAYAKRMTMEEEMPFFSPVMPMLTDIWEHASEVEA